MKKRIIAMLLALGLLLSGCGGEKLSLKSKDLMAGVKPQNVDTIGVESVGAVEFGIRLLEASGETGKNSLISPLSVLAALGMTMNGAQGETLRQMEDTLGMSQEAVNAYMKELLTALNRRKEGGVHLANAIWFKDDSKLKVEPSFLQTNANYYGADAYEAPFDESTLGDINDWVSYRTNDMIENILDRIPEDALMYLVNALSFEAQWQNVYYDTAVRDREFTREDGTVEPVELMYDEEFTTFLECDNATGFLRYYQGGEYAFAALLPKEGVSLDEVLENLTGEALCQMVEQGENVSVFSAIPKFEAQSSYEMSESLETMGMTDAFDWRRADFSALGTYEGEGENICISRVLHKTFITVGEQGTKAGAATVVEMAEEGAAMTEPREVILNRPFLYMILDTKTNMPLFLGTLYSVQ